jgi:acyl-coenzyme A thioesterase PaaI-like protein
MATNPKIVPGPGLTLLPSEEHDLQHYLSIPWTRSLLTTGDQTIFSCRSRHVKPTGEDNLYAKTLATSDTFSRYLCFHPPAIPLQGNNGRPALPSISSIVRIEGGLNGFAGLIHGSIICTLFDETMGILLAYNSRLGYLQVPDHTGSERTSWSEIFTGELTTRFLRPVDTGTDVLVGAYLQKVEGRKFFVTASLKDSEGNELATAKATWIAAKGKKSSKL